uniref:(northern house mosquito) hypothetical protein n=1 Tax=Culex pipiens TaxID=7175 RepID=A0A8D8E923_CULPI
MAKSSSPHCTDRRRFCSTRTIHFFYAQLCHCSAPIFRDFLAIFSHFFTDFPCTFCPFFTPNAHQKCPGALLHRSLCAALREQANTSRTELSVSRSVPNLARPDPSDPVRRTKCSRVWSVREISDTNHKPFSTD